MAAFGVALGLSRAFRSSSVEDHNKRVSGASDSSNRLDSRVIGEYVAPRCSGLPHIEASKGTRELFLGMSRLEVEKVGVCRSVVTSSCRLVTVPADVFFDSSNRVNRIRFLSSRRFGVLRPIAKTCVASQGCRALDMLLSDVVTLNGEPTSDSVLLVAEFGAIRRWRYPGVAYELDHLPDGRDVVGAIEVSPSPLRIESRAERLEHEKAVTQHEVDAIRALRRTQQAVPLSKLQAQQERDLQRVTALEREAQKWAGRKCCTDLLCCCGEWDY